MSRYLLLFTLFTLSSQIAFGQRGDDDSVEMAYVSSLEIKRYSAKSAKVKTVEPVRYVEMCGEEIPSATYAGDSRLTLNGVGLRQARFLGRSFDVYLASLYTGKIDDDPHSIINSKYDKQIDVYFLRDLDKGKLEDSYEWKDGLKRQDFFNFGDELRAEIYQNVISDVKEGQKLTMLISGDRVEFFLDDEFLYASDNPDFAKALLGVYLLDHQEEKLSRGLLGDLNFDC